MGIGNQEVADHQTQIAMSDRIKDSIALIDMFVWVADGCQCDRKGMMTSCTRGSFRQTIRLDEDVLFLNVLLSWIGKGCHHISLPKNLSILNVLLLLYSSLMKTSSDSQHALVNTVTARMPLLFFVVSVQHVVLCFIARQICDAK